VRNLNELFVVSVGTILYSDIAKRAAVVPNAFVVHHNVLHTSSALPVGLIEEAGMEVISDLIGELRPSWYFVVF
jgi:hypothetical protein